MEKRYSKRLTERCREAKVIQLSQYCYESSDLWQKKHNSSFVIKALRELWENSDGLHLPHTGNAENSLVLEKMRRNVKLFVGGWKISTK